jgi:tryptophan synthase alpha chain
MLENIAKPALNPINQLFKDKKSNILSVYFTAGYPSLHDTVPTIQTLEQAGADLIEIGIPFSDPIADGETIQQSSQQALKNGMNLTLLFQQLAEIRKTVKIPLILMGYLNPIIQFGMQQFCQKCLETGINGLIIPDLPMYEYLNEYKQVFENHGLENIFLITPQTNAERIQHIDLHTKGFIYMVSSASVTGAKQGISSTQIAYFQRIAAMKLKNPLLVGFGISDKQTFDIAARYANGAIIGSAFIKAVGNENLGTLEEKIKKFIASINV